ncbi:hypothetical protein PPTG_16722 [Phytophthora nicotianae INRA-310]|uniref:Uncharacterized protein n=1 Tax=Phytophthora nicotianae (strain INRA-310) TaxID=761204 RepID=W2PPV5_PHYN3|nr:hypothetical protein PPTG_16722 [Phytophthora nicotianae INRA-310]ETN02055.1 hypothetical protein PPTG_16722 [Phytophthora nicotianae INRA-310]
MTTTVVPHLQPLSPVTITPTLSSKVSEPLSFLSKIDRVEINHTTERDGVVYYVHRYQYTLFTSTHLGGRIEITSMQQCWV